MFGIHYFDSVVEKYTPAVTQLVCAGPFSSNFVVNFDDFYV